MDTYPHLNRWKQSEPQPWDTHVILYKQEWVGVGSTDKKYAYVCEKGKCSERVTVVDGNQYIYTDINRGQ
jgi:hypothetical protein